MQILEDKLKSLDFIALQTRLRGLSKEKQEIFLHNLDLKDPRTGFVLSLCLGFLGVDRFYNAQIGLGVLKILSLFLCLFFVFVVLLLDEEFSSREEFELIFFFVIYGVLWWVVDIFLIKNAIKKKNYLKISQNLMLMGH